MNGKIKKGASVWLLLPECSGVGTVVSIDKRDKKGALVVEVAGETYSNVSSDDVIPDWGLESKQ